MTEPLYLADSYLRSFDARVEEVDDDGVVLDRTAFYPTGGGQPHDTGTLRWPGGEASVTRVRKDHGRILHRLEGDVPPVGAEVAGEVDWDRRYALMRVHTAAHVLSAVIYHGTGALATGGQLYPDKDSRLDFDLPDVTEADLAGFEAEVNRIVEEDHALRWYEVSREEFETSDLTRLKADLLPKFIDPVRIVEIVDVDAQADGGTHVRSTAEVGPVRLTNVKSKGKENRRLYFALEARDPPDPPVS